MRQNPLLCAIHPLPSSRTAVLLQFAITCCVAEFSISSEQGLGCEREGNTLSPWWGTASHCFPVFAPLGHFWVGMDDDTPLRFLLTCSHRSQPCQTLFGSLLYFQTTAKGWLLLGSLQHHPQKCPTQGSKFLNIPRVHFVLPEARAP